MKNNKVPAKTQVPLTQYLLLSNYFPAPICKIKCILHEASGLQRDHEDKRELH